MAASSRISLHDCKATLQIPHPPPTLPPTPEQQTLQAAETPPPPLTETYIGATLFLVVTVHPPSPSPPNPDVLFHALDTLADLHVFLGHDAASARACPLPILRESRWIGSSSPAESGSGGGGVRLCKGVWALVRAPQGGEGVQGKQEVYVSLRERSLGGGSRMVPVWATIDRASRLFSRAVTISASRTIMVSSPLDISCVRVSAGGGGDRVFVCVSVTNVTDDACVSVVPPYINVNASRLVDDPQLHTRGNQGEGGGTREEDVGEELALDERYEFVPMFGGGSDSESDEEEGDDEADAAGRAQLARAASSGQASAEDYGLFIPSFTHWLKRAIALAPREAYNFVYKVSAKGHSHNALPASSAPADGGMTEERQSGGGLTAAALMRKLTPGTCLETRAAVAWNCRAADCAADSGEFPEEGVVNTPVRRELSSGGVLATGKRGNVAVRLTAVHWRPPALLDGVVVHFAGPPVAAVGARVCVAVSILNQAVEELVDAALVVQRSEGADLRLLALRTEIVVGRIAGGGETTLQLPCVALQAGTLSLGKVTVVDRGGTGQVWTSEAAFKVFVVDPAASIPGDPTVPSAREGETDARAVAAG